MEEKKCYMREGKYYWPSGQFYNGKFNNNNKFEETIEDSELIMKNQWKYKGKFINGKFQNMQL